MDCLKDYFIKKRKCGTLLDTMICVKENAVMPSMNFEQQVAEILSSTKNMEYADYRRLMYGESLHGTNHRSLMDYMVAPMNWKSYSDKKKIEEAVNSIAGAMSDYLINSPAPNTYKQRIYVIFCNWLERIGEKYNIADVHKDYLTEPIKADMGIAFLKAFHKDEAVSKKGLKEELKIDQKSVQTWLRKIDPTLSEEGGGKEGEYRIAGHHITAEIKVVDTDKYGKKYYQMPSTLHPLVLQPNVLQVGVLLKSLCQAYNTFSFTSYDIALDIWAQLSEYAKNRIRVVFGEHDEALEIFLSELTDELQRGERIRIFKTEQEIMKEGGLSPWDQISLAFKSGTLCNVRIKNQLGEITVYKEQRIVSRVIDGNREYMAIPYSLEDPHSHKDGIVIREENIVEIEFV